MVPLQFAVVALFLRVLSCLALPLNSTDVDGPASATGANALLAPAAPHFVVYHDAWDGRVGPPATSSIRGFNTYNLAFLLVAGPWDKAYEWTALTAAERSTIKSQYAAAGIKLMVSAFGATDVPTTTGQDPVALANRFASFVKQYSLDGIDIDYEDFIAFDARDGRAETWLINFTRQLRSQLPAPDFIITHAPVAPWFSPTGWGGGGYLRVHREVGSLIDWYNVQFYNQGVNEYTTCDNLLNRSSNTWPQTSIFEIAANGVPLSKIVIGKPAGTGDANNGFMSTSTLASCLAQAKNRGW
ncbi:hypothetical protein AX16_001724, partial [Volvariella volvacea WC 439]